MPIDLNSPLDIQANQLDILIQQVNIENNTELFADDFLFSPPRTAELLFSDINTAVTITPKVTSGYYGSKDIYYKRLNVTEIITNSNILITRGTATKLSELIPQVNSKYGINITDIDYLDVDLPAVDPLDPDAEFSVVLKILDTSYLFYGIVNVIVGKIPVPVDPAGYSRDIYLSLYSDDTNVYKNRFIALDASREISQTFSLFRNATNITNFDVKDFLVLSNSDICLKGEFTFDLLSDTKSPKSVIMSKTGLIKTTCDDYLFGDISQVVRYQNKGVDKVYIIDKNNLIGTNTVNKLYRYGNDGLLDTLYVPTGIDYTPSTISLCDDGKLYTASSQYVQVELDPVTLNNITVKRIRIDRLNIDGTIDDTFTPVIIRSTGVADVTPVLQIMPVNSLGAWVAMKAINTVSTGSDSPIVNNTPFVLPTDGNDGSFNTVFKFNQNGSYDDNFKQLLPNNHPDSIYIDSILFQPGSRVLNATSKYVTFISNRINPLTGYTHRSPISFDMHGNLYNAMPESLLEDVRWVYIDDVINQYNGNFLVRGKASSRNVSGGWNPAGPMIVEYNEKSQLTQILYQTAIGSTVEQSIYGIAITETMV
jgi:uncharacterized protein (DUF1330 family)